MGKTYKKHLENPHFRPLAYICAPYSGDTKRNIKKSIKYAHMAYDKGAIPVTPHLLFPFLDDADPSMRNDVMFMDIVLLGRCHELWVFGGTITKGMAQEINIAKKRHQVTRFFTQDGQEVESYA